MEQSNHSIFQEVAKFDVELWQTDSEDRERLEYVICFSNQFFPDVDAEEEVILPSMFPLEFIKAYNYKRLKHPFKLEDYIKNQNIQSVLQEVGLDSEKFWYFLLFLYTYCHNTYITGIKLSKLSIKEQLEKALGYLKENLYSIPPRDIVITVGEEGKAPKVEMTDKMLIEAFVNWDAELSVDYKQSYSNQPVKASVNKFAYHFDKYICWLLDNYKKELPFKNKIYFIEDLLIFIGIISEGDMIPQQKEEEEYYDRVKWLKGIRASYKDRNKNIQTYLFE